MKKLYFIVILLCYGSLVRSQSYIPMLDSVSNTWYYSMNMIPVRLAASVPNCMYPLWAGYPAWTFTTTIDTMVNGNNYKAILQQLHGNPGGDCLAGYIREDTASRSIYFMDNQFNLEVLIYDFSMQPGDTIDLTFTLQGYFMDGPFVLDSIATINLISGPHRLFYLHNPNAPASNILQWIEGVGHPGNLVYTASSNSYGGFFQGWCWPPDRINRDFNDIMTCFEHGPSKIYFDSCSHAFALQSSGSQWFEYVDSCVYWNMGGSVEELAGLSEFKAVPNPASESVSLNGEAAIYMEGDLFIRDIFGRTTAPSIPVTFIPGANSIPIKTDYLRSGIYLIEFKSTKGVAYTRLTIGK